MRIRTGAQCTTRIVNSGFRLQPGDFRRIVDCSVRILLRPLVLLFRPRYSKLSLSKSLKKMASEQPITDKQIATAEAKIHARKRFESVFPLLVEELTSTLRTINLPENAIEWYKDVLLFSLASLIDRI
jgi:hypothetical protein